MIALWMAYAMLVALVLSGAARSIETAIRPRTGRTRWVWLGALLMSWVIPTAAFGLSVLRPVATRGSTLDFDALPFPTSAAAPGVDAGVPILRRIAELVGSAQTHLDPWNGLFLGSWGILAAVGLLLLCASGISILIRSRSWPRTTMLGEPVRLAPAFGPALVGVKRPTIVLPTWTLELDEARQRLILHHELEHRKARDTLLLWAGALLTLTMPWNAPLWWQLRRLRLAVEVDCDARVLGSGVSPKSYGTLLLGVGTRTHRWTVPVAALAESRSFMERRLEMIASRKRSGWRSAVGVLVGGALIVVACEAPTPTASVEESLQEAQVLFDNTVRIRVSGEAVEGSDDAPLVFIDGAEASQEVFEALDPEEIAVVSVLKGESAISEYGDHAVNGVIEIETREVDGTSDEVGVRVRAVPGAFTDPNADGSVNDVGVRIRTVPGTSTDSEELPIHVIDGVVVEAADFQELDPEDIKTMSVLKGESATSLYGETAVNGVVLVETKSGSADAP